MTEPVSDRCGYTWPEDHKVDDEPNRQSCCWREVVDSSEYCIWHDKPVGESKSINELRENLVQNSEELLDGAQLYDLELTDKISLDRVSLRGSNISESNLSGISLYGADLTDAHLFSTDLTGANLAGANLTRAHLWKAKLKNVYLWQAVLIDADLSDADASNADLRDTVLLRADLREADFTDAKIAGANIINSTLEQAKFVRTDLFNTDLTDSKPYGATLTDVQINYDTELRNEDHRRQDARWWQRGPLFPPRRCGYDPAVANEDGGAKLDQLVKAADTYQSFEKLARENARPSLQSEMFVLRQDMQRKRHWHNRDYFEWGFAQLSRTVFKYGESLGRIVTVAVAVIVAYAAIYLQFDLIRDAGNQFVTDPVDALYFSTLTFTTLGLGDFQPEPTSQAARLLVTSQAASGAILIAIFVFVLGRRAAR